MKNKIKILLTLIITILLLSSSYINVFASTPDSDFMGQGKNWLELAKKEGKKEKSRWTLDKRKEKLYTNGAL